MVKWPSISETLDLSSFLAAIFSPWLFILKDEHGCWNPSHHIYSSSEERGGSKAPFRCHRAYNIGFFLPMEKARNEPPPFSPLDLFPNFQNETLGRVISVSSPSSSHLS